ncbi:MAG: carbon-nitrogen hydrolase family protein [Candidatus Hydrogenedentes bacterium]|nr:carbon-nitrogen hydrolase family protein [Candidatus Hydrogenedentota bacterium]
MKRTLVACALIALIGPGPAAAAAEIRVALLQMAPKGADVAANLEKAEEFCRKAAAKRADIALMPELWSVGFTPPENREGALDAYRKLTLTLDSEPIQRFAALAKELGMAIAITYLETHDPAPRNVITLFDRHGREVFTYAKIHTSDFTPLEAATTPGDEFVVGDLDTPAGTVSVGAMICFDREHPESARILMLKGAELVLTPNASKLDELRLDQFKVRAWENAIGVAMANYPRPHKNGRSVAYDGAGNRLVMAGAREGVYIATFDLDALRERRRNTIWGNAYRRPHRYGALDDPARDPVWDRQRDDGTRYDPAQR